MTDRDLSAEIVAALTTGEHTMLAIARTVKARNQDVIDHVRALEAAGRVYQAEGPDGRVVYGLPAAATGRSGNRPTDADRLLAVLADGRPHNHLELYGLNMIVHSRVADLRKRGHDVRSWRENHPNGRRYWYQLVAGPLTAGGVTEAGSATSPEAGSAISPPAVSGSVLDERGLALSSTGPLQLTFGEAA